MSPILESIGSVKGFGWGALTESSAFESIATLTAAGGETTLAFNSIPQTYKHLQIRGSIRQSTGTNGYGYIYIRLNSSGSQASQQIWYDATERGSGGLQVPATAAGSNHTANTFGSFVADFLYYSQANTFKISSGYGGTPATQSYSGLGIGSGLSADTSALTSIDLYSPFSEPLVAGSTLALYGIKAA